MISVAPPALKTVRKIEGEYFTSHALLREYDTGDFLVCFHSEDLDTTFKYKTWVGGENQFNREMDIVIDRVLYADRKWTIPGTLLKFTCETGTLWLIRDEECYTIEWQNENQVYLGHADYTDFKTAIMRFKCMAAKIIPPATRDLSPEPLKQRGGEYGRKGWIDVHGQL